MNVSPKQLGVLWVYLKLALGLLLIGLVLVFASQNADVVTVRFLSWRFHMSQSLLIFLAFATGAVSGSLAMGWFTWRRARARKQRAK
jgi:uncharacterized integral membrane protein